MLTLCRSNEHLVARDDDYSFIRTTGNIFTNFSYSQCLNANYIAFQNKDYSNKWFFAFIDEVIYRGEENTEIRYTIDAWSTWYDKWSVEKCFIERQHVLNDTIGSNLVDENLNVGEIIEEENWEFTGLSSIYYVLMSTWNPYTIGSSTVGNYDPILRYNKNIWGGQLYLFTSPANIKMFLKKINNQGHIEEVTNFFILPRDIFPVDDIITWQDTYQGNNYTFYTINDENSAYKSSSRIIDFDMTTAMNLYSFNDITVKNNKCKVYPYNYLFATNNVGGQNIYKIEDFSNGVVFSVEMAISIGGSIRLVPKNYKKVDVNCDESIPLAKFATCSWSSDAFTNWLTQNGVNIATSVLIAAAGIGLSVATAGAATPLAAVGVGALISTAGVAANTIGQFREATMLPSISGGNNSGDVNFASRSTFFSFHHMRAKTEYLKIIDDYFTRFGYKICKLENPNISGRRYWNYIEIGGSEEIGTGEVPSKFMETINNACRKGVTIWHNHANIGNYNLNNTIV
jgi:hypothetical protein